MVAEAAATAAEAAEAEAAAEAADTKAAAPATATELSASAAAAAAEWRRLGRLMRQQLPENESSPARGKSWSKRHGDVKEAANTEITQIR